MSKRELYEREVKQLPSPHPRGLPFSITPREIIRFLNNKFIGNEDRSMLLCDVCKEPIVSGETVVAFNYFLVHYPICYDIKVRDIPESVLDDEDLFFIEHGYYKEGS